MFTKFKQKFVNAHKARALGKKILNLIPKGRVVRKFLSDTVQEKMVLKVEIEERMVENIQFIPFLITLPMFGTRFYT